MSERQELRTCHICGEKVLWRNLGLGWVPIQYHDCKPVPRAKLEQAERERDEARALLEQATALLREVQDDSINGLTLGEARALYERVNAFLAGQPAPALMNAEDYGLYLVLRDLVRDAALAPAAREKLLNFLSRMDV